MLVGGPVFGLLRLPVLDGNRHYLVREYSCLPGRRGRRLAPGGVAVHRLPADLILRGQVLGGLRHGEPAAGIPQRLPECVLERCRGTEPETPAGAPHHVGRLAHRLGAAGQHHLRLAEHDLLGGLGHRLESGPAEPVDRHRRGLDREAGAEADMAREVDGVGRGLEDVAEDHVIDRGGLYAAPGQRPLGGDGAEVGGGEILEGAAEGAEPGADAGEEDDAASSQGSWRRCSGWSLWEGT